MRKNSLEVTVTLLSQLALWTKIVGMVYAFFRNGLFKGRIRGLPEYPLKKKEAHVETCW